METETAREIDPNGFMTVRDNPIICAGVFQYKGSSLPGAGTKGPDVLRFDLFNLEYLMKRNCWLTSNL